jgi:hypothetical protein
MGRNPEMLTTAELSAELIRGMAEAGELPPLKPRRHPSIPGTAQVQGTAVV